MTKEQKEQDFEEVYLDANVFIYSVLDESQIGEKAREIFEKIRKNKFKGFTSTLTIDEILWAVQKRLDIEKTADITQDFISMQNLEFISVDINTAKEAINLYKNGLEPRDAIHLASMQSKKINIIISSDSDFDKIKSIKRIDFTK